MISSAISSVKNSLFLGFIVNQITFLPAIGPFAWLIGILVSYKIFLPTVTGLNGRVFMNLSGQMQGP